METLLFRVGDIISPVKDIEFVQNGVKHQRFQGRQYAVIPKYPPDSNTQDRGARLCISSRGLPESHTCNEESA